MNEKYSATFATTKVHPNKPNEVEEGNLIFHSHMWVKGSLLHIIVDSGIQKNLILVYLIKILDFSIIPYLYP